MIDVKHYGLFWIRMTVRLLSIMAAWITTKWLNLTYGVYTYFLASVLLDLLFFKVLRLKESNFKSPGYFKSKFQSAPGQYDRYVSAVINAKTILFILAHAVFFVFYFKAPIEIVNAIFMVGLTSIVFRYGFKFGYHKIKESTDDNATYAGSSLNTSGEYNRIGDGLPGWRMGIYTGDDHHRG